MTTNWWPYHWACDKCGSVHYYKPSACRGCGSGRIVRKVNNQKVVDAMKSARKNKKKKPKPTEESDLDQDQDQQDLIRPIPLPPLEEEDAALGTSEGTTVQRPADPSDTDDDILDDLINGILDC